MIRFRRPAGIVSGSVIMTKAKKRNGVYWIVPDSALQYWSGEDMISVVPRTTAAKERTRSQRPSL